MIRFKRGISLVIAIGMSMNIFAACGSKKEQANSTKSTSTPVVSQAPKGPTEISLMMAAEPVFKPENNKVVAEVEKKANVKLKFIITPTSSYAEKRNLAIASGDIADVTMFESASDVLLLQGIKQGSFTDVKKYVDNAPNLQKYMSQLVFQTALTDDGKMVGIPRNTIVRGDGFIIRQDWLDKLKLKVPTTMDEYYEVMKAFAKNDPDGNGKDDTFALSANPPTSDANYTPPYSDRFIFNSGGGLGWQEDKNGKLYYTNNQEAAIREGILLSKKFISEKVCDPEFISNKTADEKFTTGKVGMKSDYVGNIMSVGEQLRKNVPTAKLTYCLPPAGKDGKIVIGQPGNVGNYWYYVISGKVKDPQAVVNYFDWWLSDDGWNIATKGLENEHYIKKDGKIEYKPEFFSDFLTWRGQFTTVKRVGTKNSDGLDYFLSVAIPEPDRGFMVDMIKKGTDVLVLDKGISHVTPVEQDFRKTDWEKRKRQLIDKVVYGQSAIEEWDKFYKDYAVEWKKVEVDMDTWYQKAIKSKK